MSDQAEPITWLERVLSDSLITHETAAWAAFAWGQVLSMTDFRMPPPAACTGPDGEVFFGWDRGRYHLELEIVPGRAAEWSYRDRELEESWLELQDRGDPIPVGVLVVLGKFETPGGGPTPDRCLGDRGPLAVPHDIVTVHLRDHWLAEGPSELCFDRDAPRMALLLDFIGGTAGEDDRADVRGHILACPRCRFLHLAIRERMENGKSMQA